VSDLHHPQPPDSVLADRSASPYPAPAAIAPPRTSAGFLVPRGDWLAFMLDRVEAGIVVHAATTEILYANAKATELLGVSADRILGTVNTDPRWSFVREDGSLMPIEEYPVGLALATRAVVRDLVLGLRRDSDGREVWLTCNAYPVLDPQGLVTEVVVTFTDITALKQVQRELQKSEERFHLVMRGSTDAPWDWDLVTDRVYYSPRWLEMIGYEPSMGPLDAALWTARLHPEDRDRVLAQLQREIRDRQGAFEAEFRLQHADGHYVLQLLRAFISRDAEGRAVRLTGCNTDITERRAIELRLRHTQKMEAIGQLAGGVAHDFNNLLAVVTGNLELLKLELFDHPSALELVNEASGAARRGADLTRRLLASTRQQALQPVVLDVVSMMDALVPVLRRLIHATIRIETLAELPLPHIRVDAGQLENALINLAINARDAMPDGGTLTVTAATLVLDAAAAEELEVLPGPYVSLSVADTGHGMSRDVMQHALEPFFTTKPVGRGSGLGLSMVYGFVKQSGGALRLTSEPGRGTEVRLCFPAVDGVRVRVGIDADVAAPAAIVRREPAVQAAAVAAPAPTPRAGACVLVVEDDPTVRRFCERALASLGFEVLSAENGPAAVALLESDASVQLLLTDVIMPGGMSGPDVVRAAQRLRPGLPALLMSGYPAHELDGDPALAEGRLLAKPFTRGELEARLRELLP
jgi:PAS domain S-box-containing protein